MAGWFAKSDLYSILDPGPPGVPRRFAAAVRRRRAAPLAAGNLNLVIVRQPEVAADEL